MIYFLDEARLRLVKHSFYNKNDEDSDPGHVLFDSEDRLILETDELIDHVSTSSALTYTCFATNSITGKLIRKTKLLISEDGRRMIIRYIYIETRLKPIQVFEFDERQNKKIIYQIAQGLLLNELFRGLN